MARFCSNCGTQVDENASFCSKCGAPINKEENANNNFTNGTNSSINFNNTDNSYYNNQPPVENKKSFSQVGLILGILGIVFAWVFALAGHALSITGIVIGAKEFKRTHNPAGLVTSIIGEICAIVSSILGILIALSTYTHILSSISSSPYYF